MSSTGPAARKAAAFLSPLRRRRCSSAKSKCRRKRSSAKCCRFCRRRSRRESPDMRARSAAAVAITAGLTLVLAPAPAPRAQDSPLLSAMHDELRRSMAELRMNGEPAPYYIEYEIDDLASIRVVARLGGIVDDLADRSRTLQVGVRVGEYGFDSSRFITQDRGAGVVPSLADLTVPLDDNYDAIRRQIWLATDAAYKRAVGVFAKKKATFQNRAATDALADFSKEQPIETLQP